MVLGKLDSCRKVKLNHPFHATHKINPKWIKDLNVRPQTIKILEEYIGSKILDIASRNILSDISPQARETKEKIKKWDLIKIKSFCTAKENINQMKREPTVWEDVFTNDTLGKGSISKIYKELT